MMGTDLVSKNAQRDAASGGLDIEAGGKGGSSAGKSKSKADIAFRNFLRNADEIDLIIKEISSIASDVTAIGKSYKKVSGGALDKKARAKKYDALRERGEGATKAVHKKQKLIKTQQAKADADSFARMRPVIITKTKAVIACLDELQRAHRLVREGESGETERMFAIIAPDKTLSDADREDIRQNGWSVSCVARPVLCVCVCWNNCAH